MRVVGGFEWAEEGGSLLGEGSFGQVYRGRETRSGGAVAVKCLPGRRVAEEELRLVAGLESDFVIRILALFPPDEELPHFAVVMKFCDTTLQAHLERRLEAGQGPLRTENIQRLVYCLANGYQAIHQANIIHRDLKPENILVSLSFLFFLSLQ